MDPIDLTECLRLLDAADGLLTRSGEFVLAAHLLSVLEPLRQRQREIALAR
jgi:hypothetical protein